MFGTSCKHPQESLTSEILRHHQKFQKFKTPLKASLSSEILRHHQKIEKFKTPKKSLSSEMLGRCQKSRGIFEYGNVGLSSKIEHIYI